MTLIINPPVNAIPVYDWVKVQDFYLAVLETVRASQALIDPDYDFEISKNRIRPYIEDSSKTQLVNCMIGARDDKNFTVHNKDIQITLMFEIIARAIDEGSDKADNIVFERAQYLSAMVEFGLSAMYNNLDPSIFNMSPRGTKVTFGDVQDIRKSESLFLFGSVNLDIIFPYNYADYSNLPALTQIKTNLDNNTYNFNY